ncbi:MAG: 4Fe-4S dicluster domain-containing protein [bacterium]|nr:4Fe-4S dicluster domain-containing protein [bacterium]
MKVEVTVAGAGPSGLSCALALAGLGRRVALVDDGPAPGGTLRVCPGYLGPAGASAQLLATMQESLGPLEFMAGETLRDLTGGPGDYRLQLTGRQLETRALVLATGLDLVVQPADHGLTPGYNLLSLTALAGLLASPAQAVARLRGRRVAFRLDVSAPDSRRQHAAALHLAAALRRDSAAEVFWFGRDLKVAGDGLDELYRETRDLGVTFFKDTGRPVVATPHAGGYQLQAWVDELPVVVPAELMVVDERQTPRLPVATGPGRSSVRLQQRSPRPGIFLAGSVRADLELAGCLADGRAAAASAEIFLRSLTGEVRAEVDAANCARCLTCVRLCAHQAIAVAFSRESGRDAAQVDPRACRGCGVCAAACPAVAIKLVACPDEEIFRRLGVTA